MKYYAIINSVDIVTFVTMLLDEQFKDERMALKHLYDTIPDSVTDRWISTNNEKGFAYPGCTWNEDLNKFIPPKPFESWILNEDTYEWDPPVQMPPGSLENNVSYVWDEEIGNWKVDC